MSITKTASDLADAAAAATSGKSTEIQVKCDWVEKLQASGAESAINNFLGSAIGFVQHYWVYIMIVAFVIALITFAIGRRHNARWIQIAMWVAIISVVLAPVISFGSKLGSGTC